MTSSVAPIVEASAVVDRAREHLVDVGEALRRRVLLAGAGATDGACGAGPADPAYRSVGLAELVGSPHLVTELVDATRRRLEREHGFLPSAQLAATRALHDHAWPAALLMSGPWLLHGVVSDLPLDAVRVRLDSGVLEVGAAGSLLPGDPDGALRDAVARHHAPVIEALAPHLRRGRRAAWGIVADDLLSGVWWAGRVLGDEAAAVRAASRLLPRARAPYPGGADFRVLEDTAGTAHVTRTRLTCCLRYRLEPDACVTCPRTCDAERRMRLAAD